MTKKTFDDCIYRYYWSTPDINYHVVKCYKANRIYCMLDIDKCTDFRTFEIYMAEHKND